MRLLLVEDDLVIATSLAKGLREQAYAVDGDTAVYEAAIVPYDAIVTAHEKSSRDGGLPPLSAPSSLAQ